MNTCIFCGNAIGRVNISYMFLIPMGDNEAPIEGAGNAHVNCILEFERAHYDYEHIAREAILQWENTLAQLCQ